MNAKRRALFLDRDGVINVDHGYVYTPERTQFVDGIFDLCRKAKDHGYLVVVITNQAGIARGYYCEQEFHAYMQWMAKEFVTHHARIDAIYFCPHHPSEGEGAYLQVCDCRKPAPGMILQAQRELNLDLASSVLIGDKASDIQAGNAAGVGSCFLLGGDLLPTLRALESRIFGGSPRKKPVI
ncbi:D-glycero-beta-D-manno-heptose 1,7-bisphosphate 7-phosphatase [Rhodanobacter sp. L36]|uniref:D-glycero-beta-D-manno-heptose 1,7-bisphosphate 7-phosphatase n=1 Tax=Rhodanobacter sp. L36 TaxID=1747221 RepID=UPI00131B6549|nr:D-glycero-beta-D-manno-heptose 1,7-bisphosphate 7-phosphatase [Rhodanobacter sp. L36]